MKRDCAGQSLLLAKPRPALDKEKLTGLSWDHVRTSLFRPNVQAELGDARRSQGSGISLIKATKEYLSQGMSNQMSEAFAYIEREYEDVKGRVELQRRVVEQLHMVEAGRRRSGSVCQRIAGR
jgi:hypothetical protein